MTIRAPALLSQDYTLTLPTTDGNTSEVLATDGNGVLSWMPALMNTLTSGNIFVGNGSNLATSVTPSGDISMTNTGVFTVVNSAITNAKVSASAAIDATKIGSGDVTSSELSFINSVISNV